MQREKPTIWRGNEKGTVIKRLEIKGIKENKRKTCSKEKEKRKE